MSLPEAKPRHGLILHRSLARSPASRKSSLEAASLLAGMALASRRADAPTFSPGFAKAFGGARRCTAFFFLFGKLSFVAWGSFRPVLVAPCTPCGVQFPPGQHHTRASAHGFVMGGTVPPPGQHHRRASAHFAAAFPELSSAILLAAATAGCCWYCLLVAAGSPRGGTSIHMLRPTVV